LTLNMRRLGGQFKVK